MEDFDFSKLESDIYKMNIDEAMEAVGKELENLKRNSPHLYAFFILGRMIGRTEIVSKLIEIVEDEKAEADTFMKNYLKNKKG